MPVYKEDFGIHKEVMVVEFGIGDIAIVCMREKDESHNSMVAFGTQEPHPIGHSDDTKINHTSDVLPSIDLVFRFTRHESVQVLIEQLEIMKQSLIDKETV